jgi:hypothetical protein
MQHSPAVVEMPLLALICLRVVPYMLNVLPLPGILRELYLATYVVI